MVKKNNKSPQITEKKQNELLDEQHSSKKQSKNTKKSFKNSENQQDQKKSQNSVEIKIDTKKQNKSNKSNIQEERLEELQKEKKVNRKIDFDDLEQYVFKGRKRQQLKRASSGNKMNWENIIDDQVLQLNLRVDENNSNNNDNNVNCNNNLQVGKSSLKKEQEKKQVSSKKLKKIQEKSKNENYDQKLVNGNSQEIQNTLCQKNRQKTQKQKQEATKQTSKSKNSLKKDKQNLDAISEKNQKIEKIQKNTSFSKKFNNINNENKENSNQYDSNIFYNEQKVKVQVSKKPWEKNCSDSNSSSDSEISEIFCQNNSNSQRLTRSQQKQIQQKQSQIEDIFSSKKKGKIQQENQSDEKQKSQTNKKQTQSQSNFEEDLIKTSKKKQQNNVKQEEQEQYSQQNKNNVLKFEKMEEEEQIAQNQDIYEKINFQQNYINEQNDNFQQAVKEEENQEFDDYEVNQKKIHSSEIEDNDNDDIIGKQENEKFKNQYINQQNYEEEKICLNSNDQEQIQNFGQQNFDLKIEDQEQNQIFFNNQQQQFDLQQKQEQQYYQDSEFFQENYEELKLQIKESIKKERELVKEQIRVEQGINISLEEDSFDSFQQYLMDVEKEHQQMQNLSPQKIKNLLYNNNNYQQTNSNLNDQENQQEIKQQQKSSQVQQQFKNKINQQNIFINKNDECEKNDEKQQKLILQKEKLKQFQNQRKQKQISQNEFMKISQQGQKQIESKKSKTNAKEEMERKKQEQENYLKNGISIQNVNGEKILEENDKKQEENKVNEIELNQQKDKIQDDEQEQVVNKKKESKKSGKKQEKKEKKEKKPKKEKLVLDYTNTDNYPRIFQFGKNKQIEVSDEQYNVITAPVDYNLKVMACAAGTKGGSISLFSNLSQGQSLNQECSFIQSGPSTPNLARGFLIKVLLIKSAASKDQPVGISLFFIQTYFAKIWSLNSFLFLPRQGSGKTTTIVCRIKFLIDSGVDPKEIIVMTFNRLAGESIKFQLIQLLGSENKIKGIRIGNIDKIAYAYYKNGKMRLNYEPSIKELSPEFLNYVQTKEGVKEVLKQRSTPEIIDLGNEILKRSKDLKKDEMVALNDSEYYHNKIVKPTFHQFNDDQHQQNFIMKEIKKLIFDYDVPGQKIGIISYMNGPLLKIESELKQYNMKNPMKEINYIIDAKVDNQKIKARRQKDWKQKISLCTIHCSKGLEWDYVFIIGCNEEIIPGMNMDQTKEERETNLEERRRLMYVAVTRCSKYLYLCFQNNKIFTKCSRYFAEIYNDSPQIFSLDKQKVKVEEVFKIQQQEEKKQQKFITDGKYIVEKMQSNNLKEMREQNLILNLDPQQIQLNKCQFSLNPEINFNQYDLDFENFLKIVVQNIFQDKLGINGCKPFDIYAEKVLYTIYLSEQLFDIYEKNFQLVWSGIEGKTKLRGDLLIIKQNIMQKAKFFDIRPQQIRAIQENFGYFPKDFEKQGKIKSFDEAYKKYCNENCTLEKDFDTLFKVSMMYMIYYKRQRLIFDKQAKDYFYDQMFRQNILLKNNLISCIDFSIIKLLNITDIDLYKIKEDKKAQVILNNFCIINLEYNLECKIDLVLKNTIIMIKCEQYRVDDQLLLLLWAGLYMKYFLGDLEKEENQEKKQILIDTYMIKQIGVFDPIKQIYYFLDIDGFYEFTDVYLMYFKNLRDKITPLPQKLIQNDELDSEMEEENQDKQDQKISFQFERHAVITQKKIMAEINSIDNQSDFNSKDKNSLQNQSNNITEAQKKNISNNNGRINCNINNQKIFVNKNIKDKQLNNKNINTQSILFQQKSEINQTTKNNQVMTKFAEKISNDQSQGQSKIKQTLQQKQLQQKFQQDQESEDIDLSEILG
ncbi:P-loop containing nucleoside triphosphate hydrolase [Pseudocohnilembus persalinus]|uniref:DNA 3'-5' helicase n=1 Tax=Pseudocohnilembus persalinus TaxID=266149 RepID=A0A0V0QWR5_PSEPJ|nr:P-loop containing nucleoside triphosphate hydrolase [Pseudocohnilembus persalinus]|eukprot:KRX06325.1 P-loop containing nucleoside triphosphate hydrolase [Pseudocohnilembus persalinus]